MSHFLQTRIRKRGSLSLTVLFVTPVPLHWQGKSAAQILPVYIQFLSICLVNPNCNESFRNYFYLSCHLVNNIFVFINPVVVINVLYILWVLLVIVGVAFSIINSSRRNKQRHEIAWHIKLL